MIESEVVVAKPAFQVVTASSRHLCPFDLASDVAIILDGDDGFILDMRSDLLALDPCAVRMMRSVIEGGAGGAATDLSEEYGLSVAEAEREVETFLQRLTEAGVFSAAAAMGGGPVSRRGGSVMARLILSFCRGQPLAGRIGLVLAALRVSFATIGWTGTLAALRRGLARTANANGSYSVDMVEAAVERACAADLSGAACKERAFSAWMLARLNGHAAELVIGVDLHPLKAHCWCVADGRPIAERVDRVSRFHPVLRYA